MDRFLKAHFVKLNTRMVPVDRAVFSLAYLPTRVAKEIKLFSNNQDREVYDTMADLYSIFIATENLERAYIRDTVDHTEYTQACGKLIAQFKTSVTALGSSFNIRDFIKTYDIRCPAAIHRLVEMGVPATTEHTTASEGEGNLSVHVAGTVQHFITLLDSLRLKLVAVDQIHPFLVDLMQSLAQVKILPSTYEGKRNILKWLTMLNQMKASDELSSEQVRQLCFDLESAHSEFYQVLARTK